ncbi:MAG: hypothetical protein ACI31R_02425 [Bacilli bacterium]
MNIYFLIMQFSIAVVLVLLYYVFIESYKEKKYTKKNLPVDLKLFIQTQKVNVKKISYKKLMKIVAIINAIDVGIVLLITNLVDSIALKLVIAIPAIFIVLYISYTLAGKVLKKKGMTLNES